MTKDDEKLTAQFVRATKDHDKAAMEEFLTRALPKLTNYVGGWCDKRGRSWGFAEAVACGSLVKALGAVEKLDLEKCGGNVMVWLVAIARNEFIECIRFMERGDCESLDDKLMRPTQGKNAREDDKRDAERLALWMTPPQELVRMEEQARRKRQRKLLDRAIRSLPELKRRVVELYREGAAIAVIAVKLNLSPARVSKILFDAKEELRRRVG